MTDNSIIGVFKSLAEELKSWRGVVLARMCCDDNELADLISKHITTNPNAISPCLTNNIIPANSCSSAKGSTLYLEWIEEGSGAPDKIEATIKSLSCLGVKNIYSIFYWAHDKRPEPILMFNYDDNGFQRVRRWKNKPVDYRFRKAKNYKMVLDNIHDEAQARDPDWYAERLFQAVAVNDLEQFIKLVEDGADLERKKCRTSIYPYSLHQGRVDIVRYLVEHHGYSIDKYPGGKPIVSAVLSGDLATVEYLVESGAKLPVSHKGYGLLELAIRGAISNEIQGLQVLSYLVKKGMNINRKVNGDCPINLVACKGSAEQLRQILQLGSDLNTRVDLNGEGWVVPILTIVVRRNLIEKTQVLIEYGADVNLIDSKGMTPLDHLLKPSTTVDEVLDEFDPLAEKLETLILGKKPDFDTSTLTKEQRRQVIALLLRNAGGKSSSEL